MTTSRSELALTTVYTAYAGITTAGGYRTNPTVVYSIRPFDQVTTFPEIGVEFGDETLAVLDSNWSVFDSLIPVHVIGAVKAANTDLGTTATNLQAAAEALLHDIKRVTVGLMKTYIVNATNAFNIIPPEKKEITFFRVCGLGEKRNLAIVGTTFHIRIRHQDASFDD